MEIDFRKFTELYLYDGLEYAYSESTGVELPDDSEEYDRFIRQYLQWLAKNKVKLPKNRKLSFRGNGFMDVPECNLPMNRLKQKGLKSLIPILNFKNKLTLFSQGVLADGNKLIASDANKLVIIENRENIPDGSITNPKTGEKVNTKYPNYQSVIPNYTSRVTFDVAFLTKTARNIVGFSENTDHLSIAGFDCGAYRTAVRADFLLQTMSVLEANGSKMLKVGFHEIDPFGSIAFYADNGNFALIMPIGVNWENPETPYLGTMINGKSEVRSNTQEEVPKTTSKKTQTMKETVPRWKADLFISLFNADGGEGFMDEEIADAEQFIQENRILSLVDVSEQIDGEAVCTFSVLSEVEPEKSTKKPKPKKVQTAKTPIKAKAETKFKPARQSKPESEVTEFPLAVTFIKSYCSWNDKVKTKTQVYTFIKRLQKAITEKRIRKASEYAPHIEYIQSRLIAFYNDMNSGTKTYEIPTAKLNELNAKCNIRWADHVVVIRSYINILNDTKTGLKDKATTLLKKIEGSTYATEAKTAIANITKSLKDYLNGKTDAPTINEMALQGLFGLAGLSDLGELPNAPINTSPANNESKIVSATDFKNASFDLMGFSGKWLQLIGNPSVPFKAMIWGTGGSGKSTLAIEFARYLAGTLNKRVLYVANEEGAGATLHEKMTRLNAFHPNLFIAKTLPPRLVEYDFVFCDSANSMQMDLVKFEQAAKLYPCLSWVLLFQTTKDGNFLGEKNWQHAVDVEVYCENGKAKALKSRFGGKEEVGVW